MVYIGMYLTNQDFIQEHGKRFDVLRDGVVRDLYDRFRVLALAEHSESDNIIPHDEPDTIQCPYTVHCPECGYEGRG